MNIDSLLFTKWSLLAKEELQGAKLGNIRMVDTSTLSFTMLLPRGTRAWQISLQSSPRTWWSHKKPAGNNTPTNNFCMVLRKHLEGATLTEITARYGDKWVTATFQRIETQGKIVSKRLELELIPNAPNLVLTVDGQVIDALHRKPSSRRDLAPGQTYSEPPHSEKIFWLELTPQEMLNVIGELPQELTLTKALATYFNGFSRPLTRLLNTRLQLVPEMTLSELSSTSKKELMTCLATLQKIFMTQSNVYFCKRGREAWLSPFLFLEWQMDKVAEFSDPNQAFASAELFSQYEERIQRLRQRIRSMQKKERTKQQKIRREMAETDRLETDKLYGDLLSIHAYLPHKYRTKITLPNLLSDQQEDVTIPLRAEWSLAENAQLYYKRYNRLKKRKTQALPFLKKSEQNLRYLDSLAYFLEESLQAPELTDLENELDALQPKTQKSRNHRSLNTKSHPLSLNYDGYRIEVGRNNVQNETLTLKTAGPDDLWLHAKEIPGSHVIIFANPGESFTEEVITYAAQLAAYYSKAKTAPKVEVDYTLRKYIKKPQSTPPGFVNYTHQKTLLVPPQKES
ncbi:MAG: NFACT family protein [Negativicoccus succinicivorans]|uniref:Rqc2 family fibronectin-binding protein n=1 Tax=Negativicoccus succinicivorans TaxID=620903 RepID=UPI0007641967|nr:NFACT family protein [Negativicoccus succinicivorans]KWZ75378.1 fibronectin-binding protein A [Anaerococcus hydrogenalis]MDU5915682.1 NFACT family protein [Negativicoccus succinicivorans]